MGSITSANAVLMLGITSLYATPQQIQGFATDDVFDADPLELAEAIMGVDGKLSAGFVYAAQKMKIALQSDSPSNLIFETWYKNSKAITDVYFANGSITLPSIKRTYTLVNGTMTVFPAVPSAKKILQPRIYELVWESITVSPTP